MLIAARYLVDRMRQPASRADELVGLRRRVAKSARDAGASGSERTVARSMRALRGELASVLDGVRSCATCVRRCSWPAGPYSGGLCCSGTTDDLFSDDEVAALTLAGTRPRHLSPPRGDHAGCSFRGPRGCSLEPVDRPNVCARYLCGELRAELAARGDIDEVLALVDRLDDEFAEFLAVRQARVEREELAAIHPGLVDDPVR